MDVFLRRNFVTGLRTLKPKNLKKTLKNLKKTLKNFFNNLGFFQPWETQGRRYRNGHYSHGHSTLRRAVAINGFDHSTFYTIYVQLVDVRSSKTVFLLVF